MAKYRKKPVEVEAVQWTGENGDEIIRFVESKGRKLSVYRPGFMYILTMEGLLAARVGDWIIKGVNGEFYPCKPDIFEKIYERVDEGL